MQAVTDSRGGHTKYRKVVTLTLLDVTTFEIVLFYVYGIHIYYWYTRYVCRSATHILLVYKVCMYVVYKVSGELGWSELHRSSVLTDS